MKITCQSCDAKYTVADEKVQGKTVKMKCRKCGATILVDSSGVTSGGMGAVEMNPSVPMPSIPAAYVDDIYLVNVGDNDQRKMTIAEIVTAHAQGLVDNETYVWADGFADWQPLAQVEPIVQALQDQASTARASAEVVFEPPRSAPPPAATSSQGGAVKFEDNSMMFSLSALTSKAPAPSHPGISSDDSGMIDLKALMTAHEESNRVSMPVPASVASAVSDIIPADAGLFAPPPPPPMPVGAMPNAAQSKPSSKAPLFIGLGVVAVVAAVIVVFVTRKGNDVSSVNTADSAAAIPATSASETVSSSASAVSSETTSSSDSASASASASTTTTKPSYAASGGKKSSSSGSSSSPGGASTAAKPATTTAAPSGKKGGNCGCAATDLMCNMKCSAGK